VTPILAGAPLPDPGASRDLPVPAVALAIGAHPDDIEFHCGATLARWAAAGTEVHFVVFTDGSKGTWDPDAEPAAVAAVRAVEAAAAAKVVGATAGVTSLGVADGELGRDATNRDVLHDQVVEIIRRVCPTVVLGHDPWRRYRLHPDHRAAGWLTVDACVAARDPHFVPHLGAAHRPDWLLLYEADQPDHVEQAPPADLDRKVAALLAHRSQWRSTMSIDDDGTGRDGFVASVVAAAGAVGAAAGCLPGESFRRLAL
jgi:LmbE family N-acetylglucosaminyl deacetylase